MTGLLLCAALGLASSIAGCATDPGSDDGYTVSGVSKLKLVVITDTAALRITPVKLAARHEDTLFAALGNYHQDSTQAASAEAGYKPLAAVLDPAEFPGKLVAAITAKLGERGIQVSRPISISADLGAGPAAIDRYAAQAAATEDSGFVLVLFPQPYLDADGIHTRFQVQLRAYRNHMPETLLPQSFVYQSDGVSGDSFDERLQAWLRQDHARYAGALDQAVQALSDDCAGIFTH